MNTNNLYLFFVNKNTPNAANDADAWPDGKELLDGLFIKIFKLGKYSKGLGLWNMCFNDPLIISVNNKDTDISIPNVLVFLKKSKMIDNKIKIFPSSPKKVKKIMNWFKK